MLLSPVSTPYMKDLQSKQHCKSSQSSTKSYNMIIIITITTTATISPDLSNARLHDDPGQHELAQLTLTPHATTELEWIFKGPLPKESCSNCLCHSLSLCIGSQPLFLRFVFGLAFAEEATLKEVKLFGQGLFPLHKVPKLCAPLLYFFCIVFWHKMENKIKIPKTK